MPQSLAQVLKASSSARSLSEAQISFNEDPASVGRVWYFRQVSRSQAELNPCVAQYSGMSMRWPIPRNSTPGMRNSLASAQISGNSRSAQPSVEKQRRSGAVSGGAIINIPSHDRLQQFTAQERAKVS